MRYQPWISLTVANVSCKSSFISTEEVWNGSRLSPAGAGSGTGYICVLSAPHPLQPSTETWAHSNWWLVALWKTNISNKFKAFHLFFSNLNPITNFKSLPKTVVLWVLFVASRDASRLVPSIQQAAIQRCLGTWRYMKSPNKIYSVN